MVYNFCWRANIMQRQSEEIVNRRNLRKLFKKGEICEIAFKEKVCFLPLNIFNHELFDPVVSD